VQTNDKVNLIEQNMATKEDIRQVITAIDNFASKTEDHERKSITNTYRINELEPKVEDHEMIFPRKSGHLEELVV
jgi:hypothetical protein